MSITRVANVAIDDGTHRDARVRRRIDSVGTWGFAAPILAVFLILFLIPLARSVYFSFTDYTGYSTDVNFVGFSNYARIFSDTSLISSLSFTLLFAVATTVLVTVAAIPLALVLNRAFAGRNLVRSVYFFPAVPSAAILGLVWGFILNPLGSGALNTMLRSVFGVGPVPWLADSHLAQASVIAVSLWSQTGWHAVLYLAYLQAIPAEYFEVARIDGASRSQQLRFITLPLLAPAMTVSWLLLMTGGLKVYDLPFTLTGGGPGFATRTLTQSIIQSGIARGDYGTASALAVLFLLAVGGVVLVQLRFSRRMEARFS